MWPAGDLGLGASFRKCDFLGPGLYCPTEASGSEGRAVRVGHEQSALSINPRNAVPPARLESDTLLYNFFLDFVFLGE
jgi:hypothetical protein